MLGYQIHATALAACRYLLSTYPDGRIKRLLEDGACPAIPGLPGRARRFRSHPLSRRRRRQ
jgi:hypothetical protein